MKLEDVRSVIMNLSEQLALQESLELVDVEIAGTPRRYIVRIYIDREGGVSISDCVSFSRSMGALLDVEDPVPGSFSLEVSSPGIERVLRKPEHFSKYLGEDVKIKFRELTGGRRGLSGKLVSVKEEYLEMECKGERIRVPFPDIKKANLKPMLEQTRSQKGVK